MIYIYVRLFYTISKIRYIIFFLFPLCFESCIELQRRRQCLSFNIFFSLFFVIYCNFMQNLLKIVINKDHSCGEKKETFISVFCTKICMGRQLSLSNLSKLLAHETQKSLIFFRKKKMNHAKIYCFSCIQSFIYSI